MSFKLALETARLGLFLVPVSKFLLHFVKKLMDLA